MLWTLILALFILCTLVQVAWFSGVFSRLAFLKNKDYLQKTGNTPSVSVIVCAHNELQNLKRLVPALLDQRYPQYEIIVVDDRSRDGSGQWLQGVDPRGKLKVLTVRDHPPGINPKKNALIKGIKAAEHDLLLLTDADCYPASRSWIAAMAGAFRPATQIVLGYSPYQKSKGLLNALIRYETLLTAMLYISRALSGNPYMGVGRNLAYRKSFFLSTGGLEKYLKVTGGDDDLFVNQFAEAANTEVALGNPSLMFSKPKSTWFAYLIQKRRHLSVGKHYRTGDKLALGLFSASHIIFWSSLVSLLVSASFSGWAVGGFAIRLSLLAIMVHKSSRKLGDPYGIGLLPIMDFLYSVFYIGTGLVALTSRKINWH